MDPNNNEESRNFAFFAKNILGIFVHWIVAIVQTILPFAFKRKSVKDEIVLITGAGSGIGQLMSVEFAKLGKHLSTTKMLFNLDNLDELLDEFNDFKTLSNTLRWLLRELLEL